MRKRWETRLIFIGSILAGAIVILLYSSFQKDVYRLTRSLTITPFPLTHQLTSPKPAVGYPMPSILCLILTSPKTRNRMEATNTTWAQRCDKTLFVYGNASIKSHEVSNTLHVKSHEHRTYLPEKVKEAFRYTYETYKDNFDWILKADDDTYVIVENLKLLLSRFDPRDASLHGCHFKKHGTHGYMSGGAGYVLSYSALRDLVVVGFKHRTCNKSMGDEDVEIAKCLEPINTKIWSSLDIDGKETFFAEPLGELLVSPYPEWLKEWSWNKPKYVYLKALLGLIGLQGALQYDHLKGRDCCGKYPISFHHLKARDILMYEQLLYRTRVGESDTSKHKRLFQKKLEMKNDTRPSLIPR